MYYYYAACALLGQCDALRDKRLPELGVILEDQDGRTVVKYVGREEALREKVKKDHMLEEKQRLKEEQKKKQEGAKVSRREGASEAPYTHITHIYTFRKRLR